MDMKWTMWSMWTAPQTKKLSSIWKPENNTKSTGMIHDVEQSDTTSDGSTDDNLGLHIDSVSVEGIKKTSA